MTKYPKPTEYANLIDWYRAVTLATGAYPECGTGSLIAVNYCALGLGEVGEVQGKIKKVWRGDRTLEEAREDILDEAGDALWYILRLADELGITLSQLMLRNGFKCISRHSRGVTKGDGDQR